MTYVAYGPLGPRTALAVSTDLREWRRLGPVLFTYDDALDIDLNLFHNKDAVFFPEPVDGAGRRAQLRRAAPPDVGPQRDQGRPGRRRCRRASPTRGSRSGSATCPSRRWREDLSALTLWSQHRFLAGPEYPFEVTKIGGGPAPLRVPEGWLLLHHGVTGRIERAFDHQQNVHYAAGAMLLDGDDPSIVIGRTAEPLLQAETE